MKGPALGLIECKSVARGMTITDVMVKRAPVRILESQPISPGKYLTLISGEVADVDEAMVAGVAQAGDLLVHHLFLPRVHETVIPALTGLHTETEIGSVGILETFSVASCVAAADLAVKTARVHLIKIRLANGLGGKAYFIVTGDLSDIEAAMDAAAAQVRAEGLLTAVEIIHNPHPDIILKGIF